MERAPGSHGLVFLALLGGDRAPGWSSHGAGAIAGLTAETTAVDIRHAALEGVAFRFAEILDRLPEVDRLRRERRDAAQEPGAVPDPR